MTAILAAVEEGTVRLVTSAALRAESSRVRNRSRRDFASRVLQLATEDVSLSDGVRELQREFEQAGLKPFDALHLACAVAARADFFCTTDDRLLKRSRDANTRTTRVVAPLELAAALAL